tara:strand:- start:2204 stop:2353 length:150 start_codon:yes stop_codon:yes gene_type:complete
MILFILIENFVLIFFDFFSLFQSTGKFVDFCDWLLGPETSWWTLSLGYN